MYRRIGVLMCSATIIAVALIPAVAQQKTVKQCNVEWTANKAAIQASGKTKKTFVAECRGQAANAPRPAAKPPARAPKPATTATSNPAANVKTAKQCNDEWTANKAAIQASKKTKKQFMAECRTQPAGASATTTSTPRPATSPPAPGPTTPSTATAPTPPPPSTAQPSTSPATAPPRPSAATAPAAAGQFASEAQAKARCPGDTVVWLNTESNIYHFASGRNYGKTKNGAYMCERDAAAAGARAAKNEKHP